MSRLTRGLSPAVMLVGVAFAREQQHSGARVGDGIQAAIDRESGAQVVILLKGHDEGGDVATRSLMAEQVQGRVLARLGAAWVRCPAPGPRPGKVASTRRQSES